MEKIIKEIFEKHYEGYGLLELEVTKSKLFYDVDVVFEDNITTITLSPAYSTFCAAYLNENKFCFQIRKFDIHNFIRKN